MFVEVAVDLAVAVGVVAQRDDVDAGGEQLVGDLRRDPDAPAAFSPLTTTKSGAWRSRSSGSSARSVRRPMPPTTSPTNRSLIARRPRYVSYSAAKEPRRRPDERDVEPAGGGARPRRPPDDDAAPARAAAPPAWRRWSSRGGSSSSCCRSALLGLWALARAAGTVLLVFLVAAVIALILNPLVKLAGARAGCPRGLAVLRGIPRILPRARRRRRAPDQPGDQPGQALPEGRAPPHRLGEPLAGRPPGLAGLQRHQRPHQEPGRDRPADPPAQRVKRARARSSPSPRTSYRSSWRAP